MDVQKSVTILSTTIVRPSEETPRGSLWLSRLDMMPCPTFTHALALYVYQPNQTQNNKPPPVSTMVFDTDILKKSLGKVLVPFYPMAGRLKVNKSNGRYEIDCNAEGVLFTEAETLSTLTDLGGRIDPNNSLVKGLFSKYDYSKGLSLMPLLMVQLTRFKCGGVSIGMSQHHYVADGLSYVLFNNSWARLTRGLDVNVAPDHDRFKYLAPRDPPRFDQLLASKYFEPSLPPLMLYGTNASVTNISLIVSQGQINVLKQEVLSSKELSPKCKITTFSVLAGHVWRSLCKARNLSEDQDVKLYIPVNGREILNNPNLPPGYIGNVVAYASCKAKAGDVMRNPLCYTVSEISQVIAQMKDPEHFRSTIDYLETRPSLEPLVRGEYNFMCPNLRINSWSKMAFNEADFGWGPPKLSGPARILHDGNLGFHPTLNNDTRLIASLFTTHMTAFEKYFFQF